MSHTTTKTLRNGLLMSAAALLLAAPSLGADADKIETVVVTGSLVQRTPGDMPTPTVVLSSDIIVKASSENLMASLATLPQIQGSLTSANSNFYTSGYGLSLANLRNIGVERTLVLINGRRQVSGEPTSSAVDLNTIPSALIDHVDVITGGASALYGSDAIAGVINVSLKDNFQGITASVKSGISSRGDGADTSFSGTMGGNFDGDKGNVVLSVTYEHSGAIMSGDRDITSTDSYYYETGYFPSYGNLTNALNVSGYSSYSANGRFRLINSEGVITGSSYNPDGTTFNTAEDGYDRNPNRYIQVPVTRRLIAANGHYDFTNWLRFFAETTFAYTSARSQLEAYPGTSEDGVSDPYSAGGDPIIIPLSNPYIPSALLTALSANSAYSSAEGIAFYRRMSDLGDRVSTVDRYMGKITIGFDGTIPFRDWRFNTYYEWGRTQESQVNTGYYDKTKLQNALNAHAATSDDVSNGYADTVGEIICDDATARAAGCVPVNLFGSGSISKAAANYISAMTTLQDYADEQVASISANGSLFTLPAGDLKMAIGAEYRREDADYKPDSATQAGTVAGNQSGETDGAFDVKEAYGEVVVPVVKDLPLVKYFELDGAVRYAYYSTAGSAVSWRYGGIYQPVDDLKFRIFEASATRAPNINELYSPSSQSFDGIGTSEDPCTSMNGTSNSNIAANCKLSVGSSTAPKYSQAQAQSVIFYYEGNDDLKPETAHTLTVGTVYTPSWLPDFEATIDFYDMRLAGAIERLSTTQLFDLCYKANPENYDTNQYCALITRSSDSTNAVITAIEAPYLNLGRLRTSGLDFSLSYAFLLGDFDTSLGDAGAFALKLDGSYLNSYNTDGENYAGYVGYNRWRGTLRVDYTVGKWDVNTTLRYIGPAVNDKFDSTEDYIVLGNRVSPYMYVDLNVSYDLTSKFQLYVGVDNLFDQQPPELTAENADTGTGTLASLYDTTGMYLYGGVRFKM